MLPEWALEHFTQLYDFKRNKAIEHLNIQSESTLPDLSFDLSGMLPDFS